MGGETKGVSCTIEHHALLFALLAKYAIEGCGEEGKTAVLEGVRRYGEERGRRMARRALEHGDALDLVSNQAYGEWRPEPGQMENRIVQTEPTLITVATKCAWCDTWKKYGMLDYGKYYCLPIDDAVYRGFRSDFSVTTLSNLSWGAECCEFDWGLPLNKENEGRLQRKRVELGDSCVRDFDFHTAHLFHTLGNVLKDSLGEKGKRAVDEAVQQFAAIFGKEYAALLEKEELVNEY